MENYSDRGERQNEFIMKVIYPLVNLDFEIAMNNYKSLKMFKKSNPTYSQMFGSALAFATEETLDEMNLEERDWGNFLRNEQLKTSLNDLISHIKYVIKERNICENPRFSGPSHQDFFESPDYESFQ